MFFTESGWFRLNNVVQSFVDTNLDSEILELHTTEWGIIAAIQLSNGQIEARAWALKREDRRYQAKVLTFLNESCFNYTKGVPRSLINRLSPPFGNIEARYRSIALLINA